MFPYYIIRKHMYLECTYFGCKLLNNNCSLIDKNKIRNIIKNKLIFIIFYVHYIDINTIFPNIRHIS